MAGRYRLGRQLGSGGFGVVFQAHDERLSRTVAIKLIIRGADVDLFQREAIALARLQHPNIVVVHDVVAQGWRVGLVLECLPGDTVDHLLQVSPLPWPRAVSIGAQVAEALHHAHGRGIVHGDVKPSNVLLAPDGGVKLTDFGTARLLQTLRSGGSFHGTPAYSAPEVIEGASVSPASDCYSLGVMLYRALTGRFPGVAPAHAGHAAVAVPTGVEALGEAVPGIPRALVELVQQCLQVDPAKRPASAGDVARLLRGLVHDRGHADGVVPPDLVASRRTRPAPGERRRVVVLAVERRHSDALEDDWPAARRAELESAERDAIVEVVRGAGALIESWDARLIRVVFGLDRRSERDVEAALRAGRQLLDRLALLPEAAGAASVAAAVHVVPAAEEEGSLRLGGDGLRRIEQLLAGASDGQIACSFEAERADPSRSRRPGAPFVGRDHEIGLLLGSAERARGAGVVVVVSGPPGIGKSRLSQELAARVRGQGFAVATVEPSRGVLSGEQRLVPELLASLEAEGLTPDARSALPSPDACILAAARSGDWRGTELVAAEPAERSSAMLVAVGRVLRLVATRRPLLLIIEDAHELGPAERQHLAAIGEAARATSLLLVITARPEYVADMPFSASRIHLTLSPLGSADEELLVQRALGAPPSPDLSREIRERAEGVPLHALELVRMMRDGAWIEHTQRGHAVLREGATLECPPSVEGIFASRIDALDSAVRALLHVGALQGREFDLAITSAVLAKLGIEAPAAELLAAADDRDLAHAAASGSRTVGCFAHALIREVAVAQVTGHHRRELHGLIASALRDASDVPAAERDEALAHHLALSSDPDAALPVLRAVAERRREACEIRAAVSIWTRIEEICGTRPELAAQAREAIACQGELLAQLQDSASALPLARRLIGMAGQAGDRRLEARARVIAGMAHRARSEATEAIAALREAERLGLALGDEPLVTFVRLLLIVPLTALGDDAAAEELLACLDVDQPLESTERTRLLMERARVYFQRGDGDRAAGLARDGLALARACGDRMLVLNGLATLAPMLVGLGQLAEAGEAAKEAAALSEAIGARATGAFVTALAAQLSHAEARLPEARARALEAMDVASCTHSPWQAAAAGLALAEIETDLGALDSALHAARTVVADARNLRAPRLLSWGLIVLGGVLLEAGLLADAETAAREALSLARQAADARRIGEALAVVARARRLAGDVGGAGLAWAEWDALARPMDAPDCLLARIERAMWLAEADRASEAERLALLVRTRASELRMPIVGARADIAACRARLAARRDEDARLLGATVRLADRLGARLIGVDAAMAATLWLTELREPARQRLTAVAERLSPALAGPFTSRRDRRVP